MKKGYTLIELLTVVSIIGVIAAVIIPTLTGGGCAQSLVKNFGGSMAVKLDPNVKLVNVTWKEDHLWILTTARSNNEEPKTYNFSEKSAMGVLQGNVTIVEK